MSAEILFPNSATLSGARGRASADLLEGDRSTPSASAHASQGTDTQPAPVPSTDYLHSEDFPKSSEHHQAFHLDRFEGQASRTGSPKLSFLQLVSLSFFFFFPRTFCPLLPQPVLFVFDWVSQKQRLKRDSHESCFSPRGALGRKGMEEAGQGQSRQLRASFRVASWEARNSFNHSLKYYLINNIRIMY